jgi:hypothetical protein
MFSHPTSASHRNMTLVFNRPHTSDRLAGAIVDDSEVEHLPVPASQHWANGGVSKSTARNVATIPNGGETEKEPSETSYYSNLDEDVDYGDVVVDM